VGRSVELDQFQQRHRAVALPIAVFKRFGEHDGGRLAATVSYYSFFSVFPLMLVFVTILGIVLKDNPDLRDRLIDGTLGQIPVIGSELRTGSLPGSGWVLVLGLATALWAGLGAVSALQYALDVLADVPKREQPNWALKKLKALAFLALFAIALTASILLSNLASLVGGDLLTGAIGLAATVVVNAALVLAMFSVLPTHRRPARELLPGVIVAAILLVILQQLGSFIVRHFIANASDTYGTFGTVIALLSWFFLLTRVLLLSAQLNVVLANRLSPRSLLATSPPTDADRRTSLLDVQRIQRDSRLGYAVSVEGVVATDGDPLGDDPPAGQPPDGGGFAPTPDRRLAR
jgi:inner membrane protein YhjD